MRQLIDSLGRADWKLLTAAIVVSLVLTAVCSAAFWALRWVVLDRPAKTAVSAGYRRSPLYVSFGTELFAILFVVDLCVLLGLVEIWKLQEFPGGQATIRLLAPIFMALTAYMAWLALVYERQSYEAWLRFSGYANPAARWSSRVVALPSYCKWWVWATMIRWLVGTVHLACIVKLARYDWLARTLPWLSN